ncbi:MAG TPA: MEDS domain-containing protein [Verrucomicrobiae bacterium]|nr:MEDS domain-containing protein [Verrucomicrobiae bacterium]
MNADAKNCQLRKTGISVVGDMPWGTHFCHFYETEDDLLQIVIPYFKAGLENNEFCVWIVFDSRSGEKAKEALREAVPNLDQCLAEGDIEIVPHTEWYFTQGALALDQVLAGWKKKLTKALAKGYAGMRASGNGTWFTGGDWKRFLEYERKLDDLIADQRMIILCTYPLAMSRAEGIFDVARTHQFTIARRRGRWEVLETPELRQAKAEIQRLNEELEQRVKTRTTQLAAANQELKTEILERRRAESKLQCSHERLRALTARMESLREQDRIQISREIHDELGQTLTGLKMDLLWVERKLDTLGSSPALNAVLDRVVAATESVDSLIITVQRIATELRPGVLDKLGLGTALQCEARRFQERIGIRCEVHLPATEPLLSMEQSTALFRIFQESLTNVARHAQATKVNVELKLESHFVILNVQDDGHGISQADVDRPDSLGLLGMKERVELLGGDISFQRKANGRGTAVTVRIPRSAAPPQMEEP